MEKNTQNSTMDLWTGEFVACGRDDRSQVSVSADSIVYQEVLGSDTRNRLSANSVEFNDGELKIARDKQLQTELIAESIDSQYVQVSIGSTRLLVPRGDLHSLCVLAFEDPEWLKSMIRLTAGRNQDFDLTDTTLALPDGLQIIASKPRVRVRIQQPAAPVLLESLEERDILKQTFALNGGSKDGVTVGMVLEGEDHQRIKIVFVEQDRSTAEAVYLAKPGEAYYWIRSRQYVSTPKTPRFLVFRKER